jgi:hypothetical protein
MFSGATPTRRKVSMAVYTVVDIIHCMKTHLSHASVWDALADTPEQAANMRTRSELMQQIAAIVKEKAWTQRSRQTMRRDPAAHQ